MMSQLITDMAAKVKILDPRFGKAIFALCRMIIEVQYMMKMLLLFNLGCKKTFVVWHVHKTVNNFTNVSIGPPLVKSVTFVCQNCSGFIGTTGTSIIQLQQWLFESWYHW